jgi:hypothetical protein
MLRRVSRVSAFGTRPHPARSALPGAALALALVALTACAGPTVVDAPRTAGQYDVSVRMDPPSLQLGQKATLTYSFVDQKSGKPAVDLPRLGGVIIQTTLVNHDMQWFRTGTATAPTAGGYPVNLRFGGPDSYRVYSEFTSAYTPTQNLVFSHTISFGNNPPSLEQPAPLVESSALENVFYGVAVRLDKGAPYHPEQATRIHYTLSNGGQPVRDLDPLNGAAGHLIIISADGEEFAHEYAQEAVPAVPNAQIEPTTGGATGSTGGNPVSGGPAATATGGGAPAATATEGGAGGTPTGGATAQPTAPPGPPLGPDLTFEHRFEKPGLYKMWLQFLYHGQIVTADYVVRVTE